MPSVFELHKFCNKCLPLFIFLHRKVPYARHPIANIFLRGHYISEVEFLDNFYSNGKRSDIHAAPTRAASARARPRPTDGRTAASSSREEDTEPRTHEEKDRKTADGRATPPTKTVESGYSDTL